ncbi:MULTISPECIES: energy transducer TonB [unclassified Flavobacterium]|uniref:energy transducer TonB n=1 Tax=unclassified Flavobacterium TaxID=196869 RepID=UPI001E656FA8|nr:MULTISPECIES: energy transducer TonB [unclassified Flavobacterium]
MKKFLILILICFAQNMFSQHKEPTIKSDPDAVINKTEEIPSVDINPEFPGGPEALHNDFLKKNYKMPNVSNLKGKIYMTFMVETNGTLSDIKVLRDIGYGTGEEAIRVLKLSPKWSPAKKNGKPVRWRYSFPITVTGIEPPNAAKLYNLTQNSSVTPVIEEKNQVYNTAGLEVKPEFPGGKEAFDKFIKENYKNPKNTEIKGRVYLTFIIEKDGSLSDIKVLRDIGFETGSEAIRVLKLSPKWIPGKQNNNVVRTLFSVPISVNDFVK